MQAKDEFTAHESNKHQVRPELIGTDIHVIGNKLRQGWSIDRIVDWFQTQHPGSPYTNRTHVDTVITHLTTPNR